MRLNKIHRRIWPGACRRWHGLWVWCLLLVLVSCHYTPPVPADEWPDETSRD